LFLVGCDASLTNKELIIGKWKVIHVSKSPFALFPNHEKLDSTSEIGFSRNGLVRLSHNDDTVSVRVFQYAISNDKLKIYLSDVGYRFGIGELTFNRMELKTSEGTIKLRKVGDTIEINEEPTSYFPHPRHRLLD
jgi:hypothetical protein